MAAKNRTDLLTTTEMFHLDQACQLITKAFGGECPYLVGTAGLGGASSYRDVDVRLMLDIYDSIVALAPAAVAEQRMHQIINIMRRVPAWAEGLPLDAEGYVAERMQK